MIAWVVFEIISVLDMNSACQNGSSLSSSFCSACVLPFFCWKCWCVFSQCLCIFSFLKVSEQVYCDSCSIKTSHITSNPNSINSLFHIVYEQYKHRQNKHLKMKSGTKIPKTTNTDIFMLYVICISWFHSKKFFAYA